MSIKDHYIKVCSTCEEEFTARRRNQIYCTSDCKVMFNNAKAKYERNVMKPTVSITQASWRILLKLHKSGAKTVSIKVLEELGVVLQSYSDRKKVNSDREMALIFYNLRLTRIDNEQLKLETHE